MRASVLLPFNTIGGLGDGTGPDPGLQEDTGPMAVPAPPPPAPPAPAPTRRVRVTIVRDVPVRVFIGIVIFLLLSGGLYWYWLAFPCVNSQFPEFYPRLGSELPGPWFSTLYGENWDWWLYAITNVNALPPMVLAMAVTHRKLHEYAFAHIFICIWALLENIVVIVVGAIRWAGWCNTSSSAASTGCNSYLWCCVYWPNAWCPNNGACTFSSGAVITSADLHRNSEMTQTWAFAFVFFLMTVWHIQVNFSLRRKWGFFPSSERLTLRKIKTMEE